MRLQLVASVMLLTTPITARVVPTSESLFVDTLFTRKLYVTAADDLPLEWSEPAQTVARAESKWDKAVISGGNLWAGMHSDDRKASFLFRTDPYQPNLLLQTVQSTQDGDMKESLKKWGYKEDEVENAKIDKECDFDAYHHIKLVFDELGMKTESKGMGGPNQCVQVDHEGGPKVFRDKDNKLPPIEDQKYIDESCGKEYRITGATFQFGVNAESGSITLINVISPAYSAQQIWKRKPATNELPQIRSISDMAWGFWNRASPGNIKNIKYLLVAMIMNEDTKALIRQAYETLTPKRSEVAVWPGFEFGIDTDAGKALLGSPVGRWAGYFLMQHKNQLGGNKFISKVRVFKPDMGALPYMVFYVDGPAPATSGQELAPRQDRSGWNEMVEAPVVNQSTDGKSVLREHVFYVRQ